MVERTHPAPDDGLATELERAGDLLEELAVTLCLDPVVFERHSESLQRFDLLAQTIREVARILRGRGDAAYPVTAIRLEEMAYRLAGPA